MTEREFQGQPCPKCKRLTTRKDQWFCDKCGTELPYVFSDPPAAPPARPPKVPFGTSPAEDRSKAQAKPAKRVDKGRPQR